MCTICNASFADVVYRYMIKVSVKHENRYASLLLWDRGCQFLLHKPASEMRILHAKNVDFFPDDNEASNLATPLKRTTLDDDGNAHGSFVQSSVNKRRMVIKKEKP